MMSPIRLSGLVLLLGASLAVAQRPQAEPPHPLLTFNLVALDDKGSPPQNLSATDLRIYDDGKLMQAAFCRPLMTAEQQTAPLGPREYSNRPTSSNSQSTLVLLDLLNANLPERGMGGDEIAAATRKLESAERLYVYLLTKEGALYPVHALPDAEGPAPPGNTNWVAQIPPLLDQAMSKTNRLRPQDFQHDVDARVRQTLSVLGDLASDLGCQPGAKSLVWISHGFPITATRLDGTTRDYTHETMHLGTDLARAGIVVYAVDQAQRQITDLSSPTSMQEIADVTAGQWLAGNTTERAILQAVREGHGTYQVGYIPPLDRWDNKFHKLRVVAANKGILLRTISGYNGDPRQADPQQRLELATLGDADDSGIGIRAAVTPSEKVKGWMHFQVRVDAADLQLALGEIYTGGFSVTWAYYTTEWQHEVWQDAPTQLRLTSAERATIMRDGVNLSFDHPVPDDVRKVRMVIRDNQSGAVGSLTVPLPK